MSQMQLMAERRFAPFFWTQFLGALNDNVFKNALAILVIFHALSVGGLGPREVVVLSAGVFILPFVLFSATAGQLADRYRKPTMVRWVKAAEILLMVIAAIGLMRGALELLLVVLFLMGAQSSFFGPVKYSILPQLLRKDELVGGNALVETGTFLAILLGTILGGLLVSVPEIGTTLVAAAVVLFAVAGFATSLRIPSLAAENPGLKISLNPVTPLRQTVRATAANHTVFLAILGICWFWFYGSCFLALLPDYGKSVLHGGEHVVTLLLALFCVGTAAGSLCCERLSGRRVELGLVPMGSIGMSLAAFDLCLVGAPAIAEGPLLSAPQFMAQAGSWRIMLDFVLIALFGGLFIVPLYTVVQDRSDPAYRSRVIAGSNILSSFFMVASSLVLMALLRADLTIPQIFAVLAMMNVAVAVYLYRQSPEFLFRFAAWVAANAVHRLRVVGIDHVPAQGPALLVCEPVGRAGRLMMASALGRSPLFVTDEGVAERGTSSLLVADVDRIPVKALADGAAGGDALDRVAAELESGNLVCVFVDGVSSPDGDAGPGGAAVERILGRARVPVVPMAFGAAPVGGVASQGAAISAPSRRDSSRVSLLIGAALAPGDVGGAELSRRIRRLAETGTPTRRDAASGDEAALASRPAARAED